MTSPSVPPVRVACVGDSITEGYALSNRAYNSYPAVLGRSLGRTYQVTNFGVGGTTVLSSNPKSYQKTTAFSNALSFKPDILIVGLGTNDSGRPLDDAKKLLFKEDYETLIAAFKAANATVKVYTCLPPPAYPLEGKKNTSISTDILPLVRDVAQSTGAQLIDLNTPLSGHEELFSDRLHPTIEGARLIAQEVYKTLTASQTPS